MKKTLLALVGAAVLAVGTQPAAFAMDYGTITVEGVATDTYVATQSIVTVTNRTEKDTVQAAKSENDRVSANFRQALRDIGIDDKDIRTSAYQISDKQYRIGETDNYRTTHVVSNTLQVTVNDMSKTSLILDAAANAGITDVNLSKMDLNNTEKQAQKQRLVVQAAKDARQKADAIAAALGTRVIGVESLNVDNYNYARPMYKAVNLMAVSDASAPRAAIENGEDTEDMHVNVIFKVK